ncbi:hypothetical protein QAD02_021872 [Eretmocerus hayati]|uniref:Uncharacterized protein n=1 Tax=Eretmocerus hayati TaxID=131215 RepID=A0ACC2PRG5_9HYME|nr:hypothetical protein QAD02_021872 [Eretmocerus hayati]
MTALALDHNLIDWIRLDLPGVDLTGVAGQLLTSTPAELAKYNKGSDAWVFIKACIFIRGPPAFNRESQMCELMAEIASLIETKSSSNSNTGTLWPALVGESATGNPKENSSAW